MNSDTRTTDDDEQKGKSVAVYRSSLGAECGLCLDEFNDCGNKVPRNLICGHTFCTDCLSKLMFYKSDSRPDIKCPKCHDITPVPESSAENLPKNFGLIEVISSIGDHRSPGELKDSPQLSRDDREMTHPLCQEHMDRISSFCLEDDTVVCSSCVLYGAHKGHKCLLLAEAAERQRQKLCQLNPEVNKQRKKMQCSLQQVEDSLLRVEKNGGVVLDAVDTQFSLLSDALEKWRKNLQMQVLERTQVRVHALMTQANELRENIENTTSVYGQTTRLIESDNLTLLENCSLTLEKVEGVFTNPPSYMPTAGPDLSADFSQSMLSEITSQLESFGTIKSVAGTVKSITVDAYHDGFRIIWDRHNLADNEGISYHLQVLVGESQPEENDYVMLYRGGNTKFTWKQELKKCVPYKFRVQVRTTEGVGIWSDPVTAFRTEPGFQWHESRCNVRVELSPDKLEAKGSSGSKWATFAGNKLIENGELYVELSILDIGKSRPGKEKLVFGVIDCTPSVADSLAWQDCKTCIGQLDDVKSFAFSPLAGTKNCYLFPEGKPYTNSIQLELDDKLGMLVNTYEGTVCFFHNGMDLGMAFDGIRSKGLLPAVSVRDKARIRLCFPPPPYSQRDPTVVRLSSFGVQSQRYHKRK